MQVEELEINNVGQFSKRDKAYYLNDSAYKPYIEYPFDIDYIEQALQAKSQHSIDRNLLVSVLNEQYEGVDKSSLTTAHINSLLNPNCYTVITAHQPSLLTGPLYYIFKILSAIKLASTLNEKHKEHEFVPVFVIGAEDHDFEEVNHMHLYGKQITWENNGKGPIGQFSLDGIAEVLDNVDTLLGDKSQAKDLISSLKAILPTLSNYGEFSFHVTQKLFDHLGLVVLRMGDKRLKKAFSPIIKKEIVERPSQALVLSLIHI